MPQEEHQFDNTFLYNSAFLSKNISLQLVEWTFLACYSNYSILGKRKLHSFQFELYSLYKIE